MVRHPTGRATALSTAAPSLEKSGLSIDMAGLISLTAAVMSHMCRSLEVANFLLTWTNTWYSAPCTISAMRDASSWVLALQLRLTIVLFSTGCATSWGPALRRASREFACPAEKIGVICTGG